MNEHKCNYCGKEANYQFKNGKWCCKPSPNQCPELRRKNSEKIKSLYSIDENGDVLFNNKLRKDEYTEERSRKQGWAKEKSKYNDIRIKKQAETLLKKYKSGEIKSPFLGKHHTEETKKKLAKNGGYRKCGSRGKQGWYKGHWCDSSWELAYVIYNLEHDIKFKRNDKGFEYTFENKIYKYYPDFILEDGTYVEIKGYKTKKDFEKISQFPFTLYVYEFEQMKDILNYVEKKYGKNFIKLYDNYEHKEIKIPCPQCGTLINKRSKLCRKCSNSKSKVNFNKPNKEELLNLLKENYLCNLAKYYNVSHTTIGRWCKKYNINYKSLKQNK